ncbi:TELO2-interacting protein 2 [Embiotoca jacksoni]|uniref:TELO2-interacting protein 2 n=1 Tax=Embiotoca jacksoni TaxID=100190 RepID=UPI0037037CE1
MTTCFVWSSLTWRRSTRWSYDGSTLQLYLGSSTGGSEPIAVIDHTSGTTSRRSGCVCFVWCGAGWAWLCADTCSGVERVVLGYLEVSDPPEETSRLNILEVLEKSSRAAWPRMRRRVPVLLRCLLRLLVDVSEDSQLADSARTQLMDRTAACIKLMDACCHGKHPGDLTHLYLAPPAVGAVSFSGV